MQDLTGIEQLPGVRGELCMPGAESRALHGAGFPCPHTAPSLQAAGHSCLPSSGGPQGRQKASGHLHTLTLGTLGWERIVPAFTL